MSDFRLPCFPVRIARQVLIGLLMVGVGTAAAHARTLTIAVAANFTRAIEEIGAGFEAKTGDKVKFSFGATGQLFAQISNGAPFDAFFSADTKTPLQAVKDGLAQPGSYFIYARGKLVLWSPDLPVKEQAEQILRSASYTHLAIANPKVAPYGGAALEVLNKLGATQQNQTRMVYGNSLAQAFQFVSTGNAELGFVALSQILEPGSPAKGHGQTWMPPQDLYTPIDQAAIILKHTTHLKAAQEFMAYLRSPAGQQVIERYGYEVPR